MAKRSENHRRTARRSSKVGTERRRGKRKKCENKRSPDSGSYETSPPSHDKRRKSSDEDYVCDTCCEESSEEQQHCDSDTYTEDDDNEVYYNCKCTRRGCKRERIRKPRGKRHVQEIRARNPFRHVAVKPSTTYYRSNLKSSMKELKCVAFKQEHIDEMKKGPFWLLIDALLKTDHEKWKSKCNKAEGDIQTILRTYDVYKDCFLIGGNELRVSSFDVQVVFGINGGRVPIPITEREYAVPPWIDRCFAAEIKGKKGQFFLYKNFIYEKLKATVEISDALSVGDVVRLTHCYLITSLLAPGQNGSMSFHLSVYWENLSRMCDYNWSKYITDFLMSQVRACNNLIIGGCAMLLPYWLCEHTCLVGPCNIESFPRFLRWDLKMLNNTLKRVDLDRIRKDSIIRKPMETNHAERALLRLNERLVVGDDGAGPSKGSCMKQPTKQGAHAVIEELNDTPEIITEAKRHMSKCTAETAVEVDCQTPDKGPVTYQSWDTCARGISDGDNDGPEGVTDANSDGGFERPSFNFHLSGAMNDDQGADISNKNNPGETMLMEESIGLVTQLEESKKLVECKEAELLEMKKIIVDAERRLIDEQKRFESTIDILNKENMDLVNKLDVCRKQVLEKDMSIEVLRKEMDEIECKMETDKNALQTEFNKVLNELSRLQGKVREHLEGDGAAEADDGLSGARVCNAVIDNDEWEPLTTSQMREIEVIEEEHTSSRRRPGKEPLEEGADGRPSRGSLDVVPFEMKEEQATDEMNDPNGEQIARKTRSKTYPPQTSMVRTVKRRTADNDRRQVVLSPEERLAKKRQNKSVAASVNGFRWDTTKGAVQLIPPSMRDMLEDMWSEHGESAICWGVDGALGDVTLKDVLAILHHERISSPVVDGWTDLLFKMFRERESLNGCVVFTSCCWEIVNDRGSYSSKTVDELLDKRIREVGSDDVLLFPLLSRGIGRYSRSSGDHWTMLRFDLQRCEWNFYNSLRPRRGRDVHYDRSLTMVTYVEGKLREVFAVKEPTHPFMKYGARKPLVCECTQQEADSVDCGVVLCYNIENTLLNRPSEQLQFTYDDSADYRARMVRWFLDFMSIEDSQ